MSNREIVYASLTHCFAGQGRVVTISNWAENDDRRMLSHRYTCADLQLPLSD